MVAQGPKERHVRIDIDRMSGAVNREIDHGRFPVNVFKLK
jgi:hypothetical protein